MRILAVTPYYKPAYQFGGPVKSIDALCEGLAHAGAKVTVFTTNAGCESDPAASPGSTYDEESGVRIVRFATSRLAPSRYFYSPPLGRAIEKSLLSYDVLYLSATWTYPFVVGAQTALSYRVPYVISPRGSFMRCSLGQKWLKKRIYWAALERRLVAGAFAVHCTARLEQRQTETFLGSVRTVVIPNAVRDPLCDRAIAFGRARRRLGIRLGDSLSIFVGRLHPEKRVGATIQAFSRVLQRLPNAYLAVAGGDDGDGVNAQKTARALGISNRVLFMGLLSRDELAELYRDAEMLALLSSRENFGMSAAEAMYAGVPVLLNKVVGLADEVEECGGGVVVGDSIEEATDAWSSLLMNPARKEIGERGRRFAVARFSQDRVATEMLGLFQEAADKSRRPPSLGGRSKDAD